MCVYRTTRGSVSSRQTWTPRGSLTGTSRHTWTPRGSVTVSSRLMAHLSSLFLVATSGLNNKNLINSPLYLSNNNHKYHISENLSCILEYGREICKYENEYLFFHFPTFRTAAVWCDKIFQSKQKEGSGIFYQKKINKSTFSL